MVQRQRRINTPQAVLLRMVHSMVHRMMHGVVHAMVLTVMQMVVQTVAADALLSECFNYTPLTAMLQFLIATVTITAAYAAHVSGWITTECKEHIDGFIRVAPTELQCAWLATLQP